jgi:hypothetical protein
MYMDDDRPPSDEDPSPPPALRPAGGGQSFGGGLIVLFVVLLGFLVAWKAPGFRFLVIGIGVALLLAWAVLTPSRRMGYDGRLHEDPNSFRNAVIGGIIGWIVSALLGNGDRK